MSPCLLSLGVWSSPCAQDRGGQTPDTTTSMSQADVTRTGHRAPLRVGPGHAMTPRERKLLSGKKSRFPRLLSEPCCVFVSIELGAVPVLRSRAATSWPRRVPGASSSLQHTVTHPELGCGPKPGHARGGELKDPRHSQLPSAPLCSCSPFGTQPPQPRTWRMGSGTRCLQQDWTRRTADSRLILWPTDT